MSAIAGFSLTDAQATPVSHTFVPLTHSRDEFVWRESGVSSVLAATLCSMAFLRVKGNAALEKIRVKVQVFALETATGNNADGYTAAPKLAYSLASVQDFIMPLRAATQQRKDLVAYSRGLTAVPQVTDALHDSVRPY